MGLFDEVYIVCPGCGNFVEFQSKAGDCRMHSYTQDSVPTEIAKDILGCVNVCGCCGKYVRAEITPVSVDVVTMVGI